MPANTTAKKPSTVTTFSWGPILASFLLHTPLNMWCSGKQSLTALNASQPLYASSPQERDLSLRILTSLALRTGSCPSMRCNCGHDRYRNGSKALLRWQAESPHDAFGFVLSRRLMHIDSNHWTGAEGFDENPQPYRTFPQRRHGHGTRSRNLPDRIVCHRGRFLPASYRPPAARLWRASRPEE